MFYEWQETAIAAIAGQNAILSAPTGSGKTWVAYRWAGLMDENGSPVMPKERVIFTAPIKALSNERYLDLRRMGFDVGLETGDFKKNSEAAVLCCTQEIYTLKYAHMPRQRVIIDEFHFIFASSERTRAYIDGIRGTSPDSMMLVMSATFGDPQTVRSYLEEMGRRDFELFETRERVTKLVFRKKGIHYSRIHDALVFVFSRRGADFTAKQIARTRKKIGRSARARLREMAEILEVARVSETMVYGVGVYYGSLFPKEKLLVEMAFRERILDVVAGTDALSLGVNLPAESVIFAQMAKYVDGPLTHNEFLQMAGRAGRKGYFDTGYVSFIPRSKAEHYDFDTETLYREVMASESEPAYIAIQPAVGRLLKGHVTEEQEARMIADCSLPRITYEKALSGVRDLLLLINRALGLIKDKKEREKLREALADLWFDEMSLTCNFAVAKLFVTQGAPDAMKAAEILAQEERNYLQALLKVKRYANRMPDGYKFANMPRIDATVERIDATVFGFEEKIRQLDLTEDTWSF
ncbi:MAG: DEAD/DEAH box helicase [Synergistaceae bacterium]|jgi:superfamily II RNA helicase|nr:DEAD/DEAH box helicase [Synergistaceae bacterium]